MAFLPQSSIGNIPFINHKRQGFSNILTFQPIFCCLGKYTPFVTDPKNLHTVLQGFKKSTKGMDLSNDLQNHLALALVLKEMWWTGAGFSSNFGCFLPPSSPHPPGSNQGNENSTPWCRGPKHQISAFPLGFLRIYSPIKPACSVNCSQKKKVQKNEKKKYYRIQQNTEQFDSH